MCDQCLTNMFHVHFEENPERDGYDSEIMPDRRGFYIGIAREEDSYYKDGEKHIIYAPGDVLVGRVNDPDFKIPTDLFTDEEWIEFQSDSEKTSPVPDEFVLGELSGNIIANPTRWWEYYPKVVKELEETFGGAPERYDSHWTSYVMTTVAGIFQDKGVPLSQEERLQWVQQFPEDKDSLDEMEDYHE